MQIREVMTEDLETVLSFGGFLGMGTKLFAIPWDMLTMKVDDHTLLLNMEKERLERAPGFDRNNWPIFDRSETDIHQYYGESPYWEASSRRAGKD